jgi:hypothetical protein
MEQLCTMRKKTFDTDAKFKPVTIRDSRFGIRKIYLTKNETPSIGTYSRPGKGPNGESSN